MSKWGGEGAVLTYDAGTSWYTGYRSSSKQRRESMKPSSHLRILGLPPE